MVDNVSIPDHMGHHHGLTMASVSGDVISQLNVSWAVCPRRVVSYSLWWIRGVRIPPSSNLPKQRPLFFCRPIKLEALLATFTGRSATYS